ncbi:hypothetical protein LTR97_001949 [Elasticomyces elasticus]|uniref:NmrA-like domain-containing protein n=1 Tax=Elasticomyces elasticus TaxID=574655 RepID=A0AAN7WEG8_9PEZI|nr:hypothetical protein LTR97_001949 [Elasticomyces elasticus]
MSPTILVVGATGNTGRSVVKTLPDLLKNTKLSSHKILALTRSVESPAAKALSQLPGVELAQHNWVEIDEAWLRERDVVRIFIASHNEPNQFAEESQFYVNALRAGVKYVVRISTTAANVHPDCHAYYPRTHWAIEAMLSQPEFSNMHWSSLQPNVFTSMFAAPAAALIKEFRKTGKQSGPLSLILNADTPTGIIDPYDVGVFAAHLLAREDVSSSQNRYVLNGPEDITGEQIKAQVEQYIGVAVENVRYQDLSFLDYLVKQQPQQSDNIIRSIKYAPITAWEGKAKAATTSKEVAKIYAPKRTFAEVLEEMLRE